MGITGIYPIIKDNCPEFVRACTLSDFFGKTLAIDAMNFMYKFLYGDEPGAHLFQFGAFYSDLVNNSVDPIFVFDGKSPKEKQKVKQEREEKKRKHREDVTRLEDELKRKKIEAGILLSTGEPSPKKPHTPKEKEEEIQNDENALRELRKKVVHVESRHIDEVKQLLRLLGAKVLEGHSEGEAVCAVLNRLGVAYAVIAEDADVMAFGGVRLITGVGASRKREDKMLEYNIPAILDKLELGYDQLIDMAILCQCDFTSKIKGIASKNAYSLIKEYYAIENIIRNMDEKKRKENIPEDFNYIGARKVFYSFLNQKEVYEYAKDINQLKYDHQAVCDFLNGKLGMHREAASKWCTVITGEAPKNNWYGEHETEDIRKRKREESKENTTTIRLDTHNGYQITKTKLAAKRICIEPRGIIELKPPSSPPRVCDTDFEDEEFILE